MLFIYNHQFCVTNVLLILQEKVKPAQASPTFNKEEKEEKEDLPDRTLKSNQVEDTLWCSEEPGAAPMPRGTDVAGQQTKEEVRDFLTLIGSLVKIQLKKAHNLTVLLWHRNIFLDWREE